MENGYECFVTTLRSALIHETNLEEDSVYFKEGNGASKEDRLYVECARQGEICEACALRTRELYEMYCGGVTMQEILRAALHGLGRIKQEGLFDKALSLEDYEAVKEDLFIRLVNFDKEKEDLAGAIYHVIGDIALVLYLRIGEVDGYTTSLKIRVQLLDKWGMSAKQVFDKAMLNTYFYAPPRIFCWEKLFTNPDYNGDNFMNLCSEYKLDKNIAGSCLSTTKRTNGAVAVFLPGVAQRLGQLLGEDFFIAFTSMHEAMIHNDKVISALDLKRILQDTVDEATAEEDFLTYRIYHYERETNHFTCIQ
jgi:hypothetical protein